MIYNQWKSYNIEEYLKNVKEDIEVKVMDSISPILIKKFDNFHEIR